VKIPATERGGGDFFFVGYGKRVQGWKGEMFRITERFFSWICRSTRKDSRCSGDTFLVLIEQTVLKLWEKLKISM
jgi:hypothetical protein